MSNTDLRQLRNAFGSFLTGVTVVTTKEKSGIPRGFTANSFTSVSLDPPMLLICMDKAAESLDVFSQSDGFAVNILAQDQVETSGLFASKRADKFDEAQWQESESGWPILADVCAWFDCARGEVVDAGDHVVIFGLIQSYEYNEKLGLGYVRGGYMHPGLEQSAVQAVTEDGKVIVGAIIECNGKILLIEDPQRGQLVIPASGLDGEAGSLSKLQSKLAEMNIETSVSSLFAVFENEENGRQSIYYRAIANCDNNTDHFWSFDEIPWERISAGTNTTMVERYIKESERQRYGVYFGGDRQGAVKTLSE